MPTLCEALMDRAPLQLGCREGAAMHDFWNWLADSPIGNLTILDGVGLVAMDVERAAQVCWGLGLRHITGELPGQLAMMHWETVDEKVKEKWREEVRAILTACGIIVPDEVGTGRLACEYDCWPWLENESGEQTFDLWDDGKLRDEGATYTITITRKEGEVKEVAEPETATT